MDSGYLVISWTPSLEVAQIYLPGVGGWVGLTVIIVQVSVQIGLNWYWTGTELGHRIYFQVIRYKETRIEKNMRKYSSSPQQSAHIFRFLYLFIYKPCTLVECLVEL